VLALLIAANATRLLDSGKAVTTFGSTELCAIARHGGMLRLNNS
jgi:hypothetical protein